jgi:hypothetical protein
MIKAKVKVFKLAEMLVGKTLPDTYGGASGRGLEALVKSLGVPIQNGAGADWKVYGLEFKSRDLDSSSPQTIATMLPEDIISTNYKDSLVFEKFQQQVRVHTRNNIIIFASVFDFSKSHIQNKLEEAYLACQHRLAELVAYKKQNPNANIELPSYIPGTKFGYLEQTGKGTSYSFRVHDGAMEELEGMAKSTYNIHFE